MVEPMHVSGQPTGFGRMEIMERVREHRGWFFALGVGFILLGALAIVVPFAAAVVTSMVIGWVMIVGGLFQGFHAVQNRRWQGWGWALAGAALHVIAGGLVVAYPITGTLTLTLIFALFFAINGIVKLVRAFQHRAMRGWGWLVFDGLVTLALGVMILSGWPGTAVWALGILVGVDLLFNGSSMLVMALASGPATEPRTAGAHP